MSDLIITIIVSMIAASLYAIFFQSKAEKLRRHIEKLPAERHRKLIIKAYITACTEDTYLITHIIFMAFIFATLALISIVSAISLYLSIHYDGGISQFLMDFSKPAKKEIEIGIYIFGTTFFSYITYKFYQVLLLNAWLTIAARVLEHISNCVCEYGTKEQFLKYKNLESILENEGDLTKLMQYAQEIVDSEVFVQPKFILDSIGAESYTPSNKDEN